MKWHSIAMGLVNQPTSQPKGDVNIAAVTAVQGYDELVTVVWMSGGQTHVSYLSLHEKEVSMSKPITRFGRY